MRRRAQRELGEAADQEEVTCLLVIDILERSVNARDADWTATTGGWRWTEAALGLYRARRIADVDHLDFWHAQRSP